MNLAISVPAAPTGIIVDSITPTVANPTISIDFTYPGNSSIKNYSWSKDGINYTTLNPAQKTRPLIIPATGLTIGTSYPFSIKAINTIGSSSASTGVSASFYTPPLAPTINSINGVSQDKKISISFSNTTDLGITNYSWSKDGINYTPLSPEQKTSPLYIPVTGLNHGSSYTFKIKAISSRVTSTESNGVLSIINIPLYSPVIEKVSYVSGLVDVYYTQSLAQETGVTTIKYSTDNGQTYTSTNVTTSPLKISGLKPRMHHQIILKTSNGSDSEPSNTYEFTYYVRVGIKE